MFIFSVKAVGFHLIENLGFLYFLGNLISLLLGFHGIENLGFLYFLGNLISGLVEISVMGWSRFQLWGLILSEFI